MSQEKEKRKPRWPGWGWMEALEDQQRVMKEVRESPVPVGQSKITSPLELGDPMALPKLVLPASSRIPRIVHWRHHSGKYVVVCGPFPDAMFRSETRDTPEKAAKLTVDKMWNRPATTMEEAYAKVLAADILEISGGENEFGPISP